MSSVSGLDISSDKHLFSEFFRLMFWRRIAECKERKHWKSSISVEIHAADTYTKRYYAEKASYHLKPRPVFSVVIWIGTSERFDLMEGQAKVLDDQQFDSYFSFLPSREYVVPFFASEATFSCRENSTNCVGKNGLFLPKSDINRMPKGWGCAQRRPLRTLAHVLLLFEPEFVLMVDDDTFVNYHLLVDRYRTDIMGVMQRLPILLGEFQGQPTQLTSKGIFAGGSVSFFLTHTNTHSLTHTHT